MEYGNCDNCSEGFYVKEKETDMSICNSCGHRKYKQVPIPSYRHDIKPEGQHKDEGKSRVDLIDPYMLEQMGHVLAFGAEKYSPDNWKHGIKHRKLIGSLLRHIYSYMRGIDNDHESGLPHLAHAGCCLMMLMGMTQLHPELDDRFKLESK